MKVIILISILFVFGCDSEREIILKEKYRILKFFNSDLKNEINLNGKKVYLKEFLEPRHLILSNDYLIIVENGLDDLFYIYDKNTLEFIRSMGKNGFGPGEISICSSIMLGDKPNEFWSYDTSTKQYMLFDADNDDPLAKSTIKQGDKLDAVVNIVPGREGNLMTRDLHSDYLFREYTHTGDLLGSYGSLENLYQNQQKLPNHFLYNILQGQLSTSPNKKYYSVSGILKDYIEVLNVEDSTIVSIRGPFNIDPQFEIDSSQGFERPIFKDDWKKMYLMSYMTNDLIYSLFIGKTQEQLKNDKGSSMIFVFNYEGSLQKVYKLNFNIISIAIDNNRIFGLSHDEEPNLVIFKIDS